MSLIENRRRNCYNISQNDIHSIGLTANWSLEGNGKEVGWVSCVLASSYPWRINPCSLSLLLMSFFSQSICLCEYILARRKLVAFLQPSNIIYRPVGYPSASLSSRRLTWTCKALIVYCLNVSISYFLLAFALVSFSDYHSSTGSVRVIKTFAFNPLACRCPFY